MVKVFLRVPFKARLLSSTEDDLQVKYLVEEQPGISITMVLCNTRFHLFHLYIYQFFLFFDFVIFCTNRSVICKEYATLW